MKIHDWMSDIRAADVMTQHMVTLHPEETLAEVAGRLIDHGISGAPVVNGGKCVGVLSATDLVNAEEQVTVDRAQFAQSEFWGAGFSMPVDVYEEQLTAIRAKIAPLSQQPVKRFMTTSVVSVNADDSLSVIVNKMIDQQIHRVIVVDAEDRLVGLVSTMDLLHQLRDAEQNGRPAD
ncbi:MAG: CBS domain-containing protein [Pirellulaceae bacterium]